MRRVNNLSDVQIVLNNILDRLEKLEIRDLDLGKRRIVNLADGIDDSDAATVGQINSAISQLTTKIKKGLI